MSYTANPHTTDSDANHHASLSLLQKQAEEKSVLLRIATLLHALSSRLNGVIIGGVPSVLNEIAMDSPQLSVDEAIELLEMLSTLIASAASTPDHLRVLLFEVHPQLLAILMSFLHSPQAMAPSDIYAVFMRTVTYALTDIICTACAVPGGASSKPTSGSSNSDAWNYLRNLMARVVTEADLVSTSMRLLTPTLPEDVQQSGAELLFALLLRIPEANDLLGAVSDDDRRPNNFSLLFAALTAAEQENPSLRAFIAACVREYANHNPRRYFLPLEGIDLRSALRHTTPPISSLDATVVAGLARIMALDPSADVRAIAAETIETVFRAEQDVWLMSAMSAADSGGTSAPNAATSFVAVVVRDVSAVLMDRLEREHHLEALTATLKLLDTLLCFSFHHSRAVVSQGQRPQSGPMAATPLERQFSSSLGESLLVGFAERLLVDRVHLHIGESEAALAALSEVPATEGGAAPVDRFAAYDAHCRIASLCAKCLRLLIQVAPFHRFASFGLVQHFATFSKLLKLCVALATDPSDPNRSHSVPWLVTKAEVSIVLALALCQDPRCRQLLDSQLMEHPHYRNKLRAAVLSNLNQASLDYFSDVWIVDATGVALTHLDAVEWEDAGAPLQQQQQGSNTTMRAAAMRPTKASVEYLFESQEERWVSSTRTDDSDAQRRQATAALQNLLEMAQSDAVVAGRLQRLTFILLTFAAHSTLKPLQQQVLLPANHNSPATALTGPMSDVDVSPVTLSSHRGSTSMPPQRFEGQVHATDEPQHPIYTEQLAAGAALVAAGGGPLPTRSSLLRQWTAHPDKAAAVQRVASTLAATSSTFTDPNATGTSSIMGMPNQLQNERNGAAMRFESSVKRPPAVRADVSVKSVAFATFDRSFKLAKQFSHFFSATGGPRQTTVYYEVTSNGLARRRGQNTASSSVAGAPPKSDRSKSWGLENLKEGDLFDFSLPIINLTAQAVEQIRAKAVRHLNVIKKSFIVTPQSAKSRRWFLYDMSTHIMPGIIHVLSQLIELIYTQGEEGVKFPLILFHNQESSNGRELDPADASIHAGNLLESVDQVRFYLASNPQPAAGDIRGSPVPKGSQSTYLQDLEHKIASLSAQKMWQNNNDVSSASPAPVHASPSVRSAQRSAIQAHAASFDYDSDN